MSLDTGRYQLYSALKTLRERWDATLEHWQDAVQQDFAETFWQPLEDRTRGALAAIDRLAQVVVRVRQECGDG